MAAPLHSPLCGWVFNRTGGMPAPIFRFDPRTGAYVNSFGCPVNQLPATFPALASFYADAELSFNSLHFVQWAADFWWVPLALSAAYLAFSLSWGPLVFGAPKSEGPAVNCKNAVAVWNLLLAVFSMAGFARTFPHLAYYGSQLGYYASVCAPAETSFGQGAAGLWTMLFIYSKVPELIDTVFLVIQKKEVIFLHWYHHFTVLLYCASPLAACPAPPPPSALTPILAHPRLPTRPCARVPSPAPSAPPQTRQAGTPTPRAPPRASTLCP